MVNQMYVQYRMPAHSAPVPVVMVHGSNHTGVTYETTPDGREGWATYFVRKRLAGVCRRSAGRGRSGFDPTAINVVREQPGTQARHTADATPRHARARMAKLPIRA